MHGKSTRKMAKSSHTASMQSHQGSAQWPHAHGPVASRSAQHGAGVADSDEPSTCQRQCQSHTASDLEGVCTTGSRSFEHHSESCKTDPMASVGNTQSDMRQPVHPQEQTDMVNVARPTGNVSTENVLLLLEHQQYRCGLTGHKLTPDTSALDHIVPIRCGGEHVIENTQVLHKDVNRAKGSMTNDEFIMLCRGVARWNATRKNRKESK